MEHIDQIPSTDSQSDPSIDTDLAQQPSVNHKKRRNHRSKVKKNPLQKIQRLFDMAHRKKCPSCEAKPISWFCPRCDRTLPGGKWADLGLAAEDEPASIAGRSRWIIAQGHASKKDCNDFYQLAQLCVANWTGCKSIKGGLDLVQRSQKFAWVPSIAGWRWADVKLSAEDKDESLLGMTRWMSSMGALDSSSAIDMTEIGRVFAFTWASTRSDPMTSWPGLEPIFEELSATPTVSLTTALEKTPKLGSFQPINSSMNDQSSPSSRVGRRVEACKSVGDDKGCPESPPTLISTDEVHEANLQALENLSGSNRAEDVVEHVLAPSAPTKSARARMAKRSKQEAAKQKAIQDRKERKQEQAEKKRFKERQRQLAIDRATEGHTQACIEVQPDSTSLSVSLSSNIDSPDTGVIADGSALLPDQVAVYKETAVICDSETEWSPKRSGSEESPAIFQTEMKLITSLTMSESFIANRMDKMQTKTNVVGLGPHAVSDQVFTPRSRVSSIMAPSEVVNVDCQGDDRNDLDTLAKRGCIEQRTSQWINTLEVLAPEQESSQTLRAPGEVETSAIDSDGQGSVMARTESPGQLLSPGGVYKSHLGPTLGIGTSLSRKDRQIRSENPPPFGFAELGLAAELRPDSFYTLYHNLAGINRLSTRDINEFHGLICKLSHIWYKATKGNVTALVAIKIFNGMPSWNWAHISLAAEELEESLFGGACKKLMLLEVWSAEDHNQLRKLAVRMARKWMALRPHVVDGGRIRGRPGVERQNGAHCESRLDMAAAYRDLYERLMIIAEEGQPSDKALS